MTVSSLKGVSKSQRLCGKLSLVAYEVIWLSMAKEDGAGRDEANPQQARECTR